MERAKKEKDELESHQKMADKQRSGGFFIKEAFKKEPILRVDKPPLAPTPDFKSGDRKRDRSKEPALVRRSQVWFESQDFISGSDAPGDAIALDAREMLTSAQA